MHTKSCPLLIIIAYYLSKKKSVVFMKEQDIQRKLFSNQEDLTEGYNFLPHIFHALVLSE